MTEIKRPWMARVDKNEMVRLLNEQLTLNPKSSAVLAIDMHRGHLDPLVASEPVDPEASARVVANTARLHGLCAGAAACR